jgi:nucleotide-binding universal stress UspA family protein
MLNNEEYVLGIMTDPIGVFQKILVPIDGSKPANDALVKAYQLAKIHGSTVEVLHVITFTEDLPTNDQGTSDKELPSAWVEDYITRVRLKDEKMLGEAMGVAKKMGLAEKVTSKLLIGKPGDAILREAHEGGFDLIIIGDRGLSGLKELVLGSVSHQVVDMSRVPVLVVK